MADFEQTRHQERQKLLNIFKGNIPGFYTNNEGFYNKDLYEKLVDSLISYHDDACLRNERLGNTLADNICKFTLAYNPGPIREDEAIPNGGLVNSRPRIGEPSVNGTNFSHPFDGSNVITKVNMEYKPTILNEVFVNMVIINEYLIAHPDAPFVPSYGFFLCPERQHEICKNGDKKNHIYISQKQLEDVISYSDFIKTANMENIIKIFVKIIEALIDLYNFKDYKIIHGDLHTGNILVKRNGSAFWIIDWGMSSFTCNGKRFTNWIEDDFTHCRNSETVVCADISTEMNPLPPIVSGAYDIFFLLRTMIRDLRGPSNLDWGDYMLKNLFKFKERRYKFIDAYNGDPYLYNILSQYPEERLYNYAELQKYSYAFILDKIYLSSKYQSFLFPSNTSFLYLLKHINKLPIRYCEENEDHGLAIWFCIEENKYLCETCNLAYHTKNTNHHRINLEQRPYQIRKKLRDLEIADQLRKKFRDEFAKNHRLINLFFNPYRLAYNEKGTRKRKRNPRKSKR